MSRAIYKVLFAIGCVALAFAVAATLGTWAEPDYTALYALAILVASSIGGIGPGLLATILAGAGTAFAQVGWTASPDLGWDDLLRISVFMAVALVVSSLAARQRRAEENLRDAVRKLKEADAAKDSFLANLSHELRTPLTSILGWATILGETSADPAAVAVAAESIRQSARTQQVLVDDLLDLSRIIFHKFHIDMQPVDLVPLARETVDLMKPAAASKQLEFELQLPKRPCVIIGDAHRIKQVIWNFLSNAVKFTPRGGHVELRVDVAGSVVSVAVSDDGIGIERDQMASLFERFQQGDGAMRKGGLGLGLAIARTVVEAHHGTVGAASDGLGKGATFSARFPLATE